MHLVSIITPVYNSQSTIKQTMQSVLDQTYSDWEHILVDDCSTDQSADIVTEYSQHDPRIKLIKLEKNSGAAVARNTAIEAATGRYISFLDSDDLWMLDKLEKQIAFMRLHAHALTYTHYKRIRGSDGTDIGYAQPPNVLNYTDLLKANQIGCLTAIYDTEPLGKVYMPLIRKRQDFGLWLSILKKIPYAYCLPECLAIYREQSHSISSNKVELLKYNWMLFRKIEGLSTYSSAYYVACNVARKVFG